MLTPFSFKPVPFLATFLVIFALLLVGTYLWYFPKGLYPGCLPERYRYASPLGGQEKPPADYFREPGYELVGPGESCVKSIGCWAAGARQPRFLGIPAFAISLSGNFLSGRRTYFYPQLLLRNILWVAALSVGVLAVLEAPRRRSNHQEEKDPRS